MAQDLSAVPWPIRTPRLTIRPARVQDLPAIFRIRSAPGVSDWLPTQPMELAAFEARLGRPELLAATLTLEVQNTLVGDLYLSVGDSGSQLEVADQATGTQADIGWVVGPEHAGRSFASEAGVELLRICFEDLGLRRARAVSYVHNSASCRVMEKIGMRREEYHVAESLHRSGRWLDTVGYALLAEEWKSRRDASSAVPGRR